MSETFAGLTDRELLEMLRQTEAAGFSKDAEWCRTVRQELRRRWMEANDADG